MAENNSVQNVKIITSEVNLRATSLRARLTDLVAIYKSDHSSDIDRAEAVDRFNEAVDRLKMALV